MPHQPIKDRPFVGKERHRLHWFTNLNLPHCFIVVFIALLLAAATPALDLQSIEKEGDPNKNVVRSTPHLGQQENGLMRCDVGSYLPRRETVVDISCSWTLQLMRSSPRSGFSIQRELYDDLCTCSVPFYCDSRSMVVFDRIRLDFCSSAGSYSEISIVALVKATMNAPFAIEENKVKRMDKGAWNQCPLSCMQLLRILNHILTYENVSGDRFLETKRVFQSRGGSLCAILHFLQRSALFLINVSTNGKLAIPEMHLPSLHGDEDDSVDVENSKMESTVVSAVPQSTAMLVESTLSSTIPKDMCVDLIVPSEPALLAESYFAAVALRFAGENIPGLLCYMGDYITMSVVEVCPVRAQPGFNKESLPHQSRNQLIQHATERTICRVRIHTIGRSIALDFVFGVRWLGSTGFHVRDIVASKCTTLNVDHLVLMVISVCDETGLKRRRGILLAQNKLHDFTIRCNKLEAASESINRQWTATTTKKGAMPSDLEKEWGQNDICPRFVTKAFSIEQWGCGGSLYDDLSGSFLTVVLVSSRVSQRDWLPYDDIESSKILVQISRRGKLITIEFKTCNFLTCGVLDSTNIPGFIRATTIPDLVAREYSYNNFAPGMHIVTVAPRKKLGQQQDSCSGANVFRVRNGLGWSPFGLKTPPCKTDVVMTDKAKKITYIGGSRKYLCSYVSRVLSVVIRSVENLLHRTRKVVDVEHSLSPLFSLRKMSAMFVVSVARREVATTSAKLNKVPSLSLLFASSVLLLGTAGASHHDFTTDDSHVTLQKRSLLNAPNISAAAMENALDILKKKTEVLDKLLFDDPIPLIHKSLNQLAGVGGGQASSKVSTLFDWTSFASGKEE